MGMVIMVATGVGVVGAAEARRHHRPVHIEVARRLCTGVVVPLTSLPDTHSHRNNNKYLGVRRWD